MGSGVSVPKYEAVSQPEEAPSLASIVQSLWKTAADAGAVEAAVRDMAKEPQDAKVQQIGCFILEGLSAGDDDDPVIKKQRQKAVEAGALDALCNACKAHPNDVVVQRQGAMAMSYLLSVLAHRQRAVEAGALDVLCHAVSCYPSDPVVAEPGVKALQEIMELGAVRDAAVEAGVLDALLSAMRAHPGSLPLQRRGAAALLSLCSGENCQLRAQKAEEAGALKALVQALRRFEDAELRRRSCAALGVMAEERGHKAIEVGALDAVVSAMQQTESDLELQCLGAGAISMICAGDLPGHPKAQRACEAGALEALAKAMLRHPAEVDLQRVSCGALGTICAGSDANGRRRATRATEAGAHDALVSMMRAHPQNPEMQRMACGVLGILCAGKDAERQQRAAAAVQAGAFDTLASALNAHEDRQLQHWACAALGSLAEASQERSTDAAGCAEALLKLCSGSTETLCWATEALALLCKAGVSEVAVEAGALELLLGALWVNRNDVETLRCLTSALGSLLSEDVGTIRLRAVKAEGIERLASVLMKNPKEDALQAAAGYALWKLCEGDDAIVYRSKVMEAEVPDLLRDALPFFQGETQRKLQEFIDLIDPEVPRCWGEY